MRLQARTPEPIRAFLSRFVVSSASGRNVAIVVVGSVSGQALVVLSSPLLTRLYSPRDFGLVTVFTSISGICGVAFIGRLNVAITLPRSDREAAAVAWLAIGMATALSVVLGGLGSVLSDPVARLLKTPGLAPYWWLLVAATFALALDQIFMSWMVRERRYGTLANRNLLQGVGQAGGQTLLGYAGVESGLLIGLVIGRIAALGGVISSGGLLRQGRPHLHAMRDAATRYQQFAVIGFWSALFNSLGTNLPLLVLSAYYGSYVIGLVGLTFRVMAAPAALIGLSVNRVFQGEASAVIRDEGRTLTHVVVSHARHLFLIGIPIAIVLLVGGPPIFSLIFGHEWAKSGLYAQCLALGFLAQLVVAPISQTLILLNRQVAQLAWDSSRLVITAGAPLACAELGASATASVIVMGVSYVVCYSVLFIACVRTATRFDRRPLQTDPTTTEAWT